MRLTRCKRKIRRFSLMFLFRFILYIYKKRKIIFTLQYHTHKNLFNFKTKLYLKKHNLEFNLLWKKERLRNTLARRSEMAEH